MTERAKVDRPLSEAEIAVIRTMLERASDDQNRERYLHTIDSLRVLDTCECGCDSIDFVRGPLEYPPMIVADGYGTTLGGSEVGLLLWALGDQLTGLEVYSLGGEDDVEIRLPLLESISASAPD